MDNGLKTVAVFLDTEFSSLNEVERDLISIALVAESTDDALYIVLANGWQKEAVSPFVRDTVLPLLTRYDPELLTRAAAAARIEEWLEGRRPDPETSILLLSDSGIDAQELEGLFEPGWAQQKAVAWRHVGTELENADSISRFRDELDALFLRRGHALRIEGGEQHHALVDARMMKLAFKKVSGGAA